jgi:hypothetical protein
MMLLREIKRLNTSAGLRRCCGTVKSAKKSATTEGEN